MGRWKYLVAASAWLVACSFDASNSGQGDLGRIDAAIDPLDDASKSPDARNAPDAPPGSPDAAPPDGPSADASENPDSLCDSALADLVLCMQFEDVPGTTTLVDESQYGNNSTVGGAAFGQGKVGQALQGGPNFDSVIPISTSLNATDELTIEAWINPDKDIEDRRGLFDNNNQYGFFLAEGNRLRCSIGGGPNLTTAEAVVTTIGQWQHVACVYNGTTLILYVDGMSVGSVLGTGTISTNGTNGSSVAQNSPKGEEFEGRMDTLRIWNSARTRAQLCAGAGLTCL